MDIQHKKNSHTVLREKIKLSLCSLLTQPHIYICASIGHMPWNCMEKQRCSFTHLPFYRGEWSASFPGFFSPTHTHTKRERAHSHCSTVGGTRSQSRLCGRDKNSCPCQKFNPSHPACSLDSHWLNYIVAVLSIAISTQSIFTAKLSIWHQKCNWHMQNIFVQV